MATITDKAAGFALLAFSSLLFVYYSIWVLILPFVDINHSIHQLFLPREYAVILPLTAGTLLLVIIGVFVAIVTISNRKPTVQVKKES
ncbi:dolichol phosphate-mannose biosynthesis regulatory protein-like [Corticium candelabrum]|uniref:dolichol phosphate-mannose biosynthesis regulatory protein-like n=1 Tax=Corticium candelabrum TaxID=121492 RepID=UPI002E253B4C|nr:dolichol phosphate-mannose biosynthesis regulatory protein-like [Corticium candelabrum]